MNHGIPLRYPLLLALLCAIGCSGGHKSAPAEPGGEGTISAIYQQTLASLRAGNPDTDGDNLPDEIERTVTHTDPLKVDTDGDGVADNVEIFGDMTWSSTDLVLDKDKDGVIAALDKDDDGDGTNDGELVDSDADGIPNYLEMYGFTYDPLSGKPKLWDGVDHSVRYYKTDPNQRSTDQDPFDDLTEISGTNMDVSVTGPGDLPMVPALPEIVVRLEGYRVTLDQEITVTQTESLEKGSTWERSTGATHSNTTEHGWEVGYEAEAGFSFPGVSASVTFHANYSGSIANTNETTNSSSQGGSLVSTEEWAKATTTNPTEAARVKLFLRVYNQGSACASNVVPTLTLRVGGHNVATFQPGNSQVNLLEPGGSYPATPGVYWVVDTNQNGEPIYLTLNELRALESGAPVSVTMTQMAADVMRKNATTGAYENMGDWNEYRARCKSVSADLYFDVGDGNFVHTLVYADDRPTSPKVTLGDAFLWGIGGFTHSGIGITYADMEGLKKQMSLDGWTICVDGATYTANGFGQGVALPAGYNIFDLRLNSNSVIVAKAPRASVPGVIDEPEITYAYYDSGTGSVNAVVGDYNGVEKVEFMDKDGVLRTMTQDIPGSAFYAYYPLADVKNYPNSYAFSATEKVRVTNVKGQTAEQTLSGIYVTPKPSAPSIQWVCIDKVSTPDDPFLEAEIVPNVNAPIEWVQLFPNNPNYKPVELKPVDDAYRRPNRWWCSLKTIPEGGWSPMEVVAYVQPGIYATAKGPFPVEKPYHVGTAYLSAYFGWWATDEWTSWALNVDNSQTECFSWEEGWFSGDDYPRPRAADDVWIIWDNTVHSRWELRMNAGIQSLAVSDIPYDDITKSVAANLTLATVDQYAIQAGSVYVLRTSDGRLAKFMVTEAVGYDPSGACNRGLWATFKYMVFNP